MEWIIALIELFIIIWLLVKIDSAEKSIKNISKYIEILTQNQKNFFESQMNEKKLQEIENIKEKKDTFTCKIN